MSRKFIKYNDRLCRILKENGERSLIIDCMATRLPVWINNDAFDDLPETEIIASDVIKGILSIEEAELNPAQIAVINKRFTMIADILPVIENKPERAEQIKATAKRFGVKDYYRGNKRQCCQVIYRNRCGKECDYGTYRSWKEYIL